MWLPKLAIAITIALLVAEAAPEVSLRGSTRLSHERESRRLTSQTQSGDFDSATDLLSLHYDHAPDKDDGHSAAADRSILESDFGCNWMTTNVVAVGGTYGENKNTYNAASETVMDAVFNSCGGGWLNAHDDWDAVVTALTGIWNATIVKGGDVWVKEGGQSDMTADVVAQLKLLGHDTKTRVHVIQHSNWNEDKTTDADLAYAKAETDYIRIKDANSYLNLYHNNANSATIDAFVCAAKAHPTLGTGWTAAFNYYNPNTRLDFSDTGELLWILGKGDGSVARTAYMGISITAFKDAYLGNPEDCDSPTPGSPEVTSIRVVDAGANEIIVAIPALSAGDTVTLTRQQLPSSFSLIAEATSAGSVQFKIDGSIVQTENVAPYALAGDSGGDYNAWEPADGTYVIAATAYSDGQASGVASEVFEVTITITASEPATTTMAAEEPTTTTVATTPAESATTTMTVTATETAEPTTAAPTPTPSEPPTTITVTMQDEPATTTPAIVDTTTVTVTATAPPGPTVTSMRIVDANANEIVTAIPALSEGDSVTLTRQQLPSSFSLIAEANSVGSVKFQVDGATVRTENVAPYALEGDQGGNYNAWNPADGTYLISATAYSGSHGSGEAGEAFEVTITITSELPTTTAMGMEPTTTTMDMTSATEAPTTVTMTETEAPTTTMTETEAATTTMTETEAPTTTVVETEAPSTTVAETEATTVTETEAVTVTMTVTETEAPTTVTMTETEAPTTTVAETEAPPTTVAETETSTVTETEAVTVTMTETEEAPTTTEFGEPVTSTATIAEPEPVTTTVAPEPLSILKFFLVDASADAPVSAYDPLVDGAMLDLSALPGNLNIVAEATDDAESVRFFMNGQLARLENVAPYAIGGDTSGDYFTFSLPVGTHVITATAYSQDQGQGSAGTTASITITVVTTTTPASATTAQAPSTQQPPLETQGGEFNISRGDKIMLHYDHAADRDDGHSAAADRTILQSTYSCSEVQDAVVAVGGAYGTNGPTYQTASELVMDAVFLDSSCYIGWQNAHANWAGAVQVEKQLWKETLTSPSGGHIWVKEGGQSDLTADVVALLLTELPASVIKSRVHVVQHSQWNEDKTTASDLSYVKDKTDYIKIKDANAYLNKYNNNANRPTIESFVAAAEGHPTFGDSWTAAFNYYSPNTRLDFSDTGELMWMLGLGDVNVARTQYMGISINEFREQYLD